MIKKIRPLAELAKRSDSDGWSSWWDIDYFCPVCHRKIRDYKSDVACDECGTFYDWRSSSPEVITKKELVRDGEVVDMTELNLAKAKTNRELRRKALNEYNKISEAINKFNNEGFSYVARIKTWERGDLQEIYPDPKEFRNMLLNMRDRYDAEISRLDKEFEEL